MKIVRNKGSINIFLLLFLLLIIAGVGTASYLLGSQKLQIKWNDLKNSSANSTPIPSPSSVPGCGNTNSNNGWNIYKNEKYGFQISYPNTYQALDDKNNLYGWPNAVVLLYNGGQAYDIAIEVWNTQAEYQKKYVLEDGLTVKKVGDKYITLWDATREEGNSDVIATFTLIDKTEE